MGEVKNWASLLEENTRLQAEMLSRSSVVWGHVALMPDAHLGLGATVGSVIATKGAVIPAAVGVDIGCGMIAVETSLKKVDIPVDLQPLHQQISLSVPSGIGPRGQRNEIEPRADKWLRENIPSDRVTGTELHRRAAIQLGTLGSGNHFVEVCLDESDKVWVVIHSGSRGVGNRLADLHIRAARNLCAEAGIELENRDLAYLLEGTESFDAYIQDMNWAQGYALTNREFMMDAVLEQVFQFVGQGTEFQRINCHHNFTRREEHYGESVWLTRKGAIFAGIGALGVVPGSMGAATYITTGLGSLESYSSSAHGAGRQRSRGAAKRELDLEGDYGLGEYMAGVAWNADDAAALMDEHPLAYKDIDQVMEDQKDLCRPIHRLRQLLNYKGT
jgi:tRNA-splicing ligase RtcB